MLIHRCLRRLLTSCIQLLLSFPALNPLTPILSPFHTTKLAHCKPFSLKIISPSTVLPTTPFLHTFSVYHLIDHVLFTTRLLHLSSYLRALHHPPQLHAFCTILLNYTPFCTILPHLRALHHPHHFTPFTPSSSIIRLAPSSSITRLLHHPHQLHAFCTILINYTPFAPSSSITRLAPSSSITRLAPSSSLHAFRSIILNYTPLAPFFPLTRLAPSSSITRLLHHPPPYPHALASPNTPFFHCSCLPVCLPANQPPFKPFFTLMDTRQRDNRLAFE